MILSEVGFEPTPTIVDQKAPLVVMGRVCTLESGALDRSAILTHNLATFSVEYSL